AAHLPLHRAAYEQCPCRDDGARGDEGARGNPSSSLHSGVVHDDGAHADEHLVFDDGPMHHGVVADDDITTDASIGDVVRHVDGRVVLNIAAGTDPDFSHVPAQHRAKPD